MKRFWKISTWCALVLLVFLPACASDDFFLNADEPAVQKVIKLTPSQREMSENNNDFACNLFRAINQQNRGNVSTIVSPISVSYLLGMLNEGADGYTQRQITDVLGLGTSLDEINGYFKKMIDEAPDVDPKVTVKIANSINVNSARGIKLISQYEADMQKYYNAQVDELDFTDSGSLRHINNWCDLHTDGMIPTILDELNPDAVMYLLNAVFFNAQWTEKFDPSDTRELDFKKQDGTTVKLPMMHLKTKAAYGQNELCEMLRLPYGSGGYSMYVMLPFSGKTIGDIIHSLSARKLEQMRTDELAMHPVDILMPRFATESATDLAGILSQMGMPLAFDYDLAEFPNMAQEHDDLYVSMMKQKAKIEVNEKGTKAAAVTVAEMATRSATSSSGYTFYATHPFVYCIVENSTGAIFFMGTYCGD